MMTLDEAREHFGVREWGFRAPLAVRLLRSVALEDDCWSWQLRVNHDGYSRLCLSGAVKRGIMGHRAAYELLVGPVPDGLTLDHLCRNRACVNPAHLEPVTHAENMRRTTRTHCRKGHEFSAGNVIARHGNRYCRACQLDYNARRRTQRALGGAA